MRHFPIFILLFILPFYLSESKSGPYSRRCFNTTTKPILMKHVDSTDVKWRTSPRNYQDAMARLKSKRINRENVTKNNETNSWIPDREATVELIDCPDTQSNCCVVENYDTFNYRIYRCGSASDCGNPTYPDGTFPATKTHHAFSTMSNTNNQTMLCSGPWNSPCQFRGHPH